MERTLIQQLLFEYHHHHDSSSLMKGGAIYYNESDLLRICHRMEKALEEEEKMATDSKDWQQNIKIAGKRELIQEMRAFLAHEE